MRRTRGLAAASLAVVLSAGLIGCSNEPPQSELISRNAAGTNSANGASLRASFGPDGSKITFVSGATDLGPTVVTRRDNLYMRDLTTGEVTLVSTNPDGTDGGDVGSGGGVFSPDGTKIAFTSGASNLGHVDTKGMWDVYLRDLATGTTTLISANAADTDSGDAGSYGPAFSPDGTTIAFTSEASDLGPLDGNAGEDVYLYDLLNGTMSLGSVDSNGNAMAYSYGPVFSPDGDRIAWNGQGEVYLRDLTTGTNTLVSINAAGTDGGDSFSSEPHFSADGTTVLFTSHSSDLGPTDTNNHHDAYVRDLVAGTTTLVSVNAAGADSGPNESFPVEFGPDGTTVLFISRANNLVPNDTNTTWDIFVRDLTGGTTELVSVDTTGTASGNGISSHPRFSSDGTRVAFDSKADNFGPTDTNRCSRFGGGGQYMDPCVDIYVRDLVTDTTTLASQRRGGGDSANFDSEWPVFRPGTYQVAFESYASNIAATDNNGWYDVFLTFLPSPA